MCLMMGVMLFVGGMFNVLSCDVYLMMIFCVVRGLSVLVVLVKWLKLISNSVLIVFWCVDCGMVVSSWMNCLWFGNLEIGFRFDGVVDFVWFINGDCFVNVFKMEICVFGVFLIV